MTTQLSERESVEMWRAKQLLTAGYPADVVDELAARTDVDLHRAIGLIERGCTPELAVRILR